MQQKEIKRGFITAVHRERYEVNIMKDNDNEEAIFAKLKSGIYYAKNSCLVRTKC